MLSDTWQGLLNILRELVDILLKILLLLGNVGAKHISQANLRYLNIETPGKALSEQTDTERVQHYEFIVTTLKAVGLHCCGADAAQAEQSIKAGLKTKGEK